MNKLQVFGLLACMATATGCIQSKTLKDPESLNYIRADKIDHYNNVPEDAISPPCNDSILAYDQLINNNWSKISKVYIEVPNSRKWYKNLFQAYTSRSILKRYKRKFDASFTWELPSGKNCEFPAKVRISGDWKDHIAVKDSSIVASLDVKLLQGNFNGYTRFKLLLPETRNGDSEIFASHLMSELGFISPRSNYVKVVLNGAEYVAIAQENPAKEMLESNHKRESAILETNEDLFWDWDNNGQGTWHSPKIINKAWIKKSYLNRQIAIEALNVFALATNQVNSVLDNKPQNTSYDDLILGGFNQSIRSELAVFRLVSLAMGGKHALNNLNRRFYYDPLTVSLLPIYYDGDTKTLDGTWLSRKLTSVQVNKNHIRGIKEDDIKRTLSKLSNIDSHELTNNLKIAGLDITQEKVEMVLANLYSKVESISQFIIEDIKPYKQKNINEFNISNYGRAFFAGKNEFILCTEDLIKCNTEALSNPSIDDLLAGDYRKDGIMYLYSGKYKGFKSGSYQSSYKPSYNFFQTLDKTSIYTKGLPRITISNTDRTLDINLNTENDKVVIKGGSLSDWYIRINAPNLSSLPLDQRYDSALITSAVTFMNIAVDNIYISSKGGLLEDSINFVSSQGTIADISIQNSRQDALDLDFSNITIENLYIANSGNDCLDVSSGEYIVKSAVLKDCYDKAISVGEGAKMVLENSNILSSLSAFVVKDSSTLVVKKGIVNKVKSCYLLYRKKQEFGSSYLALLDVKCTDKGSYVQTGSIFSKGK